jgi:hypothetical protein
METLVTAMPSLWGAALLLGIVLSLFHAVRPPRGVKGLDYATANDFEAGHRRWVQSAGKN